MNNELEYDKYYRLTDGKWSELVARKDECAQGGDRLSNLVRRAVLNILTSGQIRPSDADRVRADLVGKKLIPDASGPGTRLISSFLQQCLKELLSAGLIEDADHTIAQRLLETDDLDELELLPPSAPEQN